jgi:hypothetical protein
MPTRTAPTRPHRRTARLRGPATDRQLAVLRRIAAETGRTFDPNLTAGEASELIEQRIKPNPKAARAHARAQRKRRKLDRKLLNPAASWRFGDKQIPEQEEAEIKQARRDGLEAAYVELQAWVRAKRSVA